MRRSLSLRARANVAIATMLVAIALLGAAGIWWISAFTRETGDIRDRWLRDTQYLGDLANYTSDLRAAEGEQIARARMGLALLPASDVQDLHAEIADAMAGFQRTVHDARETALYGRFLDEWWRYLRIAGSAVRPLADAAGVLTDADPYVSTSKAAYTAASDDLARLTVLNNTAARAASDRANRTIAYARLSGAMTVVAVVALVVGVFVFTERSMTGPLVDLSAAMQRLSGGDFTVELAAAARRDEIGRMARAVMVFRDNAVNLREAQAMVARHALHLEELLAQEQRLGQQHRTFMSMASHEFRTPMTIVDGHAQRLINAAGTATRDAVVVRAKKIRVAIKGMRVMIDNLLETSRMLDTDQPIAVRPSSFDLRDLVEEVCVLHEEIGHQVAIERDIPDEPMTVYGDRQLLSLALNNLLSNAIKYSVDDNRVRVAVTSQDGHAHVLVVDKGIGIAGADIYRVFDRYYRGRNAITISGNGVGLFIVKAIAEWHRGSIAVDSVVGRGSVFTLGLPLETRGKPSAFADGTTSSEPVRMDLPTTRVPSAERPGGGTDGAVGRHLPSEGSQ